MEERKWSRKGDLVGWKEAIPYEGGACNMAAGEWHNDGKLVNCLRVL